jgi:hypothetical protein
VIEHRYWGNSTRLPTLTMENLRFHTIDQAIQYMVYFTNNVKLPCDQDGLANVPHLSSRFQISNLQRSQSCDLATMQSQRKTQAGLYQGPQDLPSLLNANEWSPSTLFPRPKPLDRIAFPPKRPQPYLDLIKRLSGNRHPDLKYLRSELDRQNGAFTPKEAGQPS